MNRLINTSSFRLAAVYAGVSLIAFLQTLIAFCRDRAVVNEDVWALVPSDKAIAFRVVEPLNRTFKPFHERPLRHAISDSKRVPST